MSEFDEDRELVEPVDDKKTTDPAGEPPPKWYTPQQILTGFKDCPEKQQLTILLVVTGFIGLGLGLLQPSLQLAVEQGQVLAGTVSYPAHNSYYIYQVNAWNLWGQLAGLGLFLGLSEAAVSFVFSGLAGLLFFWGMALWFFIFSKDIRLSILAPLFLIAIHSTLSNDELGTWDFNYPLMLMGEPHTYGMLGSLLVFLVYALIANSWYRGAFLLLGIMPGLHLSLGFWLTLTVLIAMLWDRQELFSNLKYTLLGYVLCIASFFWQRLSYPIDRLEPSLESYYLDPYLTYWDNHRYSPMLFPKFGIIIIVSVVFVGAMCLLIQKLELSKGEKFLLRSMIVIAVVATGFTLVSQLPLPYENKISMLLPSRFLNVISLGYTPIFLGLMWRFRRTPEIEVILPISIMAFALPHMGVMQPFWSGMVLIVFSLVLPLALIKQHKLSLRALIPFYIVYAGFAALVYREMGILTEGFVSFIALVIATGLIVFWKRPSTRKKQNPGSFGRISELATLLGLLIIAGSMVISVVTTFKELLPGIYPTKYDPILAEISKTDEGLLLVASEELRYMQLLTGRAVLMEPGSLNMIPYSIHSAPDVALILNDVYGVDYFNPPVETRHRGYLATLDTVQQLWEERTSEEWSNLAQEYDFSQILTSADWELQLPIVIGNRDLVLYEVQ